MPGKYIAAVAALLIAIVFSASAYAGTLDAIKEKKKITIGVKYDFPPFGYLDEKGNLKGFDIQVANYIAEKIGVVPEFRKATSQERINALLNGDVDIVIASMTKNPYRAKMIDFTKTYFVDGLGMLAAKASKIGSEKDLDNRIIAVIMGSTGEKYLTSGPINFKALALFREYTDAVDALKQGKVDVVVTDYAWCLAQQKASNGALIALKTALAAEPFGIGVKKNNKELLDKLNEVLADMWKDGSYKRAYGEYFGQDPDFNLMELKER